MPTTKTKLVWRLSKLPTVEELRDLVKDKVITNEEAREILFSSETLEDRDKKSFESEIKFLRELVEKLSERSRVIETIKEVYTPYYKYPWYKPYAVWCGGDMLVGGTSYFSTAGGSSTNVLSISADATPGGATVAYSTGEANTPFSGIKTF